MMQNQNWKSSNNFMQSFENVSEVYGNSIYRCQYNNINDEIRRRIHSESAAVTQFKNFHTCFP